MFKWLNAQPIGAWHCLLYLDKFNYVGVRATMPATFHGSPRSGSCPLDTHIAPQGQPRMPNQQGSLQVGQLTAGNGGGDATREVEGVQGGLQHVARQSA